MATFKDHVIIVTGASEGIGRALCRVLAPQHPKLVLAARNQKRLQELARSCEQAGAQTLVVPTDVADEAACRHLIEQTVAHFGRLDVLVNNAGASMWSRLADIHDSSIFENLMKINYLGSVYCTFYALPHLRAGRGRIVAVASVAGLTGVPTRTAYSASKHAMIGFFDSLRIELAGSGVTVTVIAPDFVATEIRRRGFDGDGWPMGESPLEENRIMTAEACAELIVRAMAKRRRLLITSWRGRLVRWMKLIAPGLVDRLAARAVRER